MAAPRQAPPRLDVPRAPSPPAPLHFGPVDSTLYRSFCVFRCRRYREAPTRPQRSVRFWTARRRRLGVSRAGILVFLASWRCTTLLLLPSYSQDGQEKRQEKAPHSHRQSFANQNSLLVRGLPHRNYSWSSATHLIPRPPSLPSEVSHHWATKLHYS